jgi:hypothetical protein
MQRWVGALVEHLPSKLQGFDTELKPSIRERKEKEKQRCCFKKIKEPGCGSSAWQGLKFRP